ncbi:MAG: exonuclease SbcCD subunit D C-terminal domain-containing protein, partial [Pseudomonadota bacterium]
QVRTLTGTLEDLLDADVPPSDDFIQVVLTDQTRRIDPMKRLWERFPNACSLTYAQLERKSSGPSAASKGGAIESAPELIAAFLEYTRDRPPSAKEQSIIADELAKVSTTHEDAA